MGNAGCFPVELWQGVMGLRLDKVEAAGISSICAAAQLPDPRKTMFVAVLLIFLQALDGILTSVGVSRFGIAAEGNPILRHLMLEFGHLPILGAVKFLAILFIIGLSYYAQRLVWVHRAMGAISCIYIFTAILPWTYILFFHGRI